MQSGIVRVTRTADEQHHLVPGSSVGAFWGGRLGTGIAGFLCICKSVASIAISHINVFPCAGTQGYLHDEVHTA